MSFESNTLNLNKLSTLEKYPNQKTTTLRSTYSYQAVAAEIPPSLAPTLAKYGQPLALHPPVLDELQLEEEMQRKEEGELFASLGLVMDWFKHKLGLGAGPSKWPLNSYQTGLFAFFFVLFAYNIAVWVLNPSWMAFPVFCLVCYVLFFLIPWKAVSHSKFGQGVGKVCYAISDAWYRIPVWIRRTVGFGLVFLSMILMAVLQPSSPTGTVVERVISLIGVIIFLALLVLASRNPRRIDWDTVGVGITIAWLLGIFVFRTSVGYNAFSWFAQQVVTFLDYANVGLAFVVGPEWAAMKIFLFTACPVIIYFAAFVAILQYWGVIDALVGAVSQVIQLIMKVSGAEATVGCASPFLGMTEAPIMVRAFLNDMTRAELHSIMTSGFGTISGAVFGAYVSLGVDPRALLTACIMSAFLSMALSKIIYPETRIPVTSLAYIHQQETDKAIQLKAKSLGIPDATIAVTPPQALAEQVVFDPELDKAFVEEAKDELDRIRKVQVDESDHDKAYNFIHAAANGSMIGFAMAVAIVAMLISFLSLFALVDAALVYIGSLINIPGLTFEKVFSYIFYPIAFFMGVPPGDCLFVASLLAKKLFINEFAAYVDLAAAMKAGFLSERAITIATYSLCGFANIGSTGMMIGSLAQIVPNRTDDLAKSVVSAMLTGTFSTWIMAAMAGILT